MVTSSRSYEFISDVRGFHVYRQEWHPEQNGGTGCLDEVGMFLTSLLLKRRITTDESQTIYHEKYRVHQISMDRGVQITAILTDTHYKTFTPFQGGLEIPCLVKVLMPANTVWYTV